MLLGAVCGELSARAVPALAVAIFGSADQAFFRLSYPPIRWQTRKTGKAKVPKIPKTLQGKLSSNGIEDVCWKDEYTV